jgi:hypothetical protein
MSSFMPNLIELVEGINFADDKTRYESKPKTKFADAGASLDGDSKLVSLSTCCVLIPVQDVQAL